MSTPVHNSPNLCQPNPVLIHNLFLVRFILILHPIYGQSLTTNIQSSLLTCLCMSHYISCPSHPPPPDHPNNIWWRLQTMTLLVTSLFQSCCYFMGRDIAEGTATRYGLIGPGIESRWRRDLLHPSRPALGSTQPPKQWAQGLFPGGKVAGAWSWPPHTFI